MLRQRQNGYRVNRGRKLNIRLDLVVGAPLDLGEVPIGRRLLEGKILPNSKSWNVHLMRVDPRPRGAYRLLPVGLIFYPIKWLQKRFVRSNRTVKDRGQPLVFSLSDIQCSSA